MELKIDKKFSRGFVIAVFSLIIGYMLLRETDRVRMIWNFLKGIFSPFIIGALLAFILNVPMRFFENKLSKLKNEKVRRITAICLMLLSIAVVIAAVLLLLVPQIEDTVKNLINQLPDFFLGVTERVNQFMEEHPQIRDLLGLEQGHVGDEWKAVVETVMNALETSISSILGGAVDLVGSLATGIINAVFSIIFAFYCLARKETLARQGR